MFTNKHCPHCKTGNLFIEDDGFEKYEKCFQCGRRATPIYLDRVLTGTIGKLYNKSRE